MRRQGEGLGALPSLRSYAERSQGSPEALFESYLSFPTHEGTARAGVPRKAQIRAFPPSLSAGRSLQPLSPGGPGAARVSPPRCMLGAVVPGLAAAAPRPAGRVGKKPRRGERFRLLTLR